MSGGLGGLLGDYGTDSDEEHAQDQQDTHHQSPPPGPQLPAPSNASSARPPGPSAPGPSAVREGSAASPGPAPGPQLPAAPARPDTPPHPHTLPPAADRHGGARGPDDDADPVAMPLLDAVLPQHAPACSPELEERLARLVTISRERGITLGEQMRGKREARNPNLMSSLVERAGLLERGSALPHSVFDPLHPRAEDFVEALANEAAQMRAQKERERRERAAPQFVSGGLQTDVTGMGGVVGGVSGGVGSGAMQAAIAAAQAKAREASMSGAERLKKARLG